uniref:Uncharacterized protein n=1 Tax=Anopheles albimanus TaxID=7167 RepID=A0A182F9U7_ANOAL
MALHNNKSVLANADWKKLWLESGQLSSGARIDNHLDSSDSTLIDDGEKISITTAGTINVSNTLPPASECPCPGEAIVGVGWIRFATSHEGKRNGPNGVGL